MMDCRGEGPLTESGFCHNAEHTHDANASHPEGEEEGDDQH